jgi:hypothetical protein
MGIGEAQPALMLIPLVGPVNSAAMNRRSQYLAALLCLSLLGGCAYDRNGGWRWDASAAGRGVIDSETIR